MESHEKHQKSQRKQHSEICFPTTAIPPLNDSPVRLLKSRPSTNLEKKRKEVKETPPLYVNSFDSTRSRLEVFVEKLKRSETPRRGTSGRNKKVQVSRSRSVGKRQSRASARSRTPEERNSSETKETEECMDKFFHADKEILPPEIIKTQSKLPSSPIYTARKNLTSTHRVGNSGYVVPATVRVSVRELMAKKSSKQKVIDEDLKRMEAIQQDIKKRYYPHLQEEKSSIENISPFFNIKSPKTPSRKPYKILGKNSSTKKRSFSAGRQYNREKIDNLQKEWDLLINLADQELSKTSSALNGDLTSPTPIKPCNDIQNETDFLLGKMYEKNLEYWDQQVMSENPSFGIRVPDNKHGYLSSYSKRYSIKRYLDRNPEKQDCMRRKLIFTPGKKEKCAEGGHERGKEQSQEYFDSEEAPNQPLFKSPSVQERLEKLRKSSEDKKKRLNENILPEETSKITSSLLNEVSSTPVRKALLKKEVLDFGNKYIILDVMKKRLLSHENVKGFVTRVIEENDVDTMKILIKDPKIRHMMIETLGELVLVKMMNGKQETEQKQMSKRNPTSPDIIGHEPPRNKLYIPREQITEEDSVPIKESQLLDEESPLSADLIKSLRWEYIKLMEDERRKQEQEKKKQKDEDDKISA